MRRLRLRHSLRHRVRRHLIAALSAPTLAVLPLDAGAQEVSEHDYLNDLPVVLSVSRLAQPLNEVPGAVTVLDAETIRRSGARSVAELLRLVPGFLLTRRVGTAQASYHAALDVYGARMQVYVDGRSVYSPYYLGDTQRGLLGVVLEDIDRIEVQRGSNSASYGANAFLGVVNIVTRHAADAPGVMLSVTQGEGGVSDSVARLGVGNEAAALRLTAARSGDYGLSNLYDDNRLTQLHLRADIRPAPQDDVILTAGALRQQYGEGSPASPCVVANLPFLCDTNKQRTNRWEDWYVTGAWTRTLSANETLRVFVSHEQESIRDEFLAERFALVPVPAPLGYHSAWASTSGRGQRSSIEIQHTLASRDGMRLVWGVEARREAVVSQPVFRTGESLSQHQLRLFGNLEWRPAPAWIVNAGGLLEKNSITGSSVAPRLFVNHHLLPDHTVRAGVTRAFRSPGIYELRANSWLDISPSPPFGPTPRALASGTVKPETMLTQEVGYLGRWRDAGLMVDVRGYVERMNKRIWASNLDSVNLPGPTIRGVEYQLEWRPAATSRLLFSEAHTRILRGREEAMLERLDAPHRTSSLAWFQELPGNLDLSVLYAFNTPYRPAGQLLDARHQLDARLAWKFRVGATRAEAAIAVQSADGGHQEFQRAYRFERRTLASLRLDF